MAAGSIGLQTYIWNNNLKSILLLAGFPLLLFLMIFAFHFGMGISQNLTSDQVFNYAISNSEKTWHIPLIIAGIWFVIAFFFHQKMIDMASHAREVSREEFPEIYNILENLCISRGISMPKLGIIESPALNAFASGISPKNYRITLTTGIIEALNKEELEAVLGHELTHIMNKDVRLLIIAVIFVGMISFFAEMAFRNMQFSGRRRNSDKNAGKAMIIAAIVLAIGYVLAIIIRFAISRRREFMADAGSVELTKNPDAMISALEKISGKARIEGMVQEVSQMCIENEAEFASIFATHPSIEKRIEAIRKYSGGMISPWSRFR